MVDDAVALYKGDGASLKAVQHLPIGTTPSSVSMVDSSPRHMFTVP